MPVDLAAISALGVDPIPGAAPAGENIQDDLIFDKMSTGIQLLVSNLGERTEMQAIGGNEAVTWEYIGDHAFELLKNKSKDLRLGGMLTLSMLEQHGFIGFQPCIEMLHGLLTNFWDTMWPPLKLIRGRQNAMAYISTHAAAYEGVGGAEEAGGRIDLHYKKLIKAWRAMLDANPTLQARNEMFEQIEQEMLALKSAGETIAKLREAIYEKFPADKLPPVSALTDAIKLVLPELESLVKQNKPAAPNASPAAGAGAEPGVQASPATTSAPMAPRPAAASAPMGSADSPEEVRKLFGRCATVLRTADLTDAASYRLARWALWGSMTAAPPTTDGVVTRVPAVQKPEVDQAAQLVQASNWIMVLQQAENRMNATPLWLDRQRHIWQALNGLGPAYKAARDSVKDELAALLRRLPMLSQMKFADGLPFADAETQAWIENEVLVESGGGGGGGGGIKVSGDNEALAEAFGKARQLARDGKLADAIRLLQESPTGSQSARERFLWRMAQAQIATEAGKGKAMIPFWTELVDQIDRYRLEEWEPELSKTVFRALWKLGKGDKEFGELAKSVFNRLCRLDPAAALE